MQYEFQVRKVSYISGKKNNFQNHGFSLEINLTTWSAVYKSLSDNYLRTYLRTYLRASMDIGNYYFFSFMQLWWCTVRYVPVLCHPVFFY